MKYLLLLLAIASLTACGTAAAQTEPFDNAQYIADIQSEATRTSQLNDRTDALLTANEALSATASAVYAGIVPTPQTKPLSQLTEAEMRAVACQLLTIEYVDAFPGFGPATAADLRTNLGC